MISRSQAGLEVKLRPPNKPPLRSPGDMGIVESVAGKHVKAANINAFIGILISSSSVETKIEGRGSATR